jgi:hypothetical protein
MALDRILLVEDDMEYVDEITRFCRVAYGGDVEVDFVEIDTSDLDSPPDLTELKEKVNSEGNYRLYLVDSLGGKKKGYWRQAVEHILEVDRDAEIYVNTLSPEGIEPEAYSYGVNVIDKFDTTDLLDKLFRK